MVRLDRVIGTIWQGAGHPNHNAATTRAGTYLCEMVGSWNPALGLGSRANDDSFVYRSGSSWAVWQIVRTSTALECLFKYR